MSNPFQVISELGLCLVFLLNLRSCISFSFSAMEKQQSVCFCDLQGYAIDGTTLVVRYPDRIHTRLGVSRDASTESSGKNG